MTDDSALHHRHMTPDERAFWQQFLRSGRWGTCVECPVDSAGNKLPEHCVHTGRGDHRLTLESLVERYRRFVPN